MPVTRTPETTASNPDARVCLVSLRGVNRHAAWCSNYEFEDVICAVDDVDLLAPTPGGGYALRQWLARRLIWRPGLARLPFNPGLRPLTVRKDYDLCVFVCMNLSDLLYLRGVRGWRERSRTTVCIVVEFYSNWIAEYARHLRLLNEFDHVFFCFDNCVAPVSKHFGRPCHHLPLGADVLRFTPFPSPPERVVDVYSMGRRSEPAHRLLLDMVRRGELFYLHDTIPGGLVQPADHVLHRNLVANIAKRSRLFVTFPAKVDQEGETRGESEVGARFYEGAAAGAVMIGQAPSIASFRKDFAWEDAVLPMAPDADALKCLVSKWIGDRDRREVLSRRNAIEALRRFDWAYRWKAVLEHVGLAPNDRLLLREQQLRALADAAQHAAPGRPAGN